MSSTAEPVEGSRDEGLPDGADTAEETEGTGQTETPGFAEPDPVDADALAEAINDPVDSAGS